jgi:predicted TIM-barrel enzyme
MVHPRPLTKSGALAIKHGTDALIITGSATGVETPLEKIIEVRKVFPSFPILVGAGVNEKNIREQFSYANGAIVGSSIKTNGIVDYKKAKKLRMKLTQK